MFSSAVRALGNPNDPQYAFASDLVNGVVNDGLAAAGEPGTGVGAQPAASPDAGLALPDPTLSLNSELDDLANGPPDLLADAGGGIPAPAAQRSTARALLDNIEQQIGYRLSPEQRMRTLEFVLGLLPITGEATSIYELVMGKSPLSGDEASRWIAAIGVVTGGYGADAVKGLRVATLERAVQRHIGEVEALAAREGLPVVRESSGTKGAWSEALNGELKPGTVYILESGHTYVTDALGRVSKAEGVLDLLKVDRNTYQQIMAGKIGGEGYDGGHLLATLYGGAGEKVNLIPQLSAVNRGEFREMERTWADAIREGKSVKVEVSPVYSNAGKVPDVVEVRYWVDGVLKERTFPNKPGG